MICKTVNCGFWLALRSPETQTYSDVVLIVICERGIFFIYLYKQGSVLTELVTRFFVGLLVAHSALVGSRRRPRSSVSEFHSQPTADSFTECVGQSLARTVYERHVHPVRHHNQLNQHGVTTTRLNDVSKYATIVASGDVIYSEQSSRLELSLILLYLHRGYGVGTCQ